MHTKKFIIILFEVDLICELISFSISWFQTYLYVVDVSQILLNIMTLLEFIRIPRIEGSTLQ